MLISDNDQALNTSSKYYIGTKNILDTLSNVSSFMQQTFVSMNV